MNRLEEALREALRREDAPEGFAARVLARVASPAPGTGRWDWLLWPQALRWATAVTLSLVLLLVVQFNTERRRRAEGELAKAQVVTALRITAEKLQYAREKVVRATNRGPAAGRPVNSI